MHIKDISIQNVFKDVTKSGSFYVCLSNVKGIENHKVNILLKTSSGSHTTT